MPCLIALDDRTLIAMLAAQLQRTNLDGSINISQSVEMAAKIIEYTDSFLSD